MRRGGRTRKIEHLQTHNEGKYLKTTAEILQRDFCLRFLYKFLHMSLLKLLIWLNVQHSTQLATGRETGLLPFNTETLWKMLKEENSKLELFSISEVF